MNYDVILVRYGELSLKSTYVRKYFESILVRNIKKALAQESIPHSITKERGRIYLSTTEISKSIMVLSRIFGIVSFSPAVQTTSDMEDMSMLALQLAKTILTEEKSFAIRATRVGTHTFSSQQVAVHIGNDIVKATHAGVDLTNPDIELFIEIRDKKSFLFTEKLSGVGGLPLGTQGKILARISHPASLLAAWYLLHRGCTLLIATTKQLPNETIHSFLSHWYAPSDIIAIDPTARNYTKNLSFIALKYDCDAIVTGHTLENPCYTLSEIALLKKHSNLPILTPLIALEEKEIENLCQMRGIPA